MYCCTIILGIILLVFHIYSALSDNEPVYAQVDRHHKNRTPERSQRTHRRHMSACVQVPTTESADEPDMPIHEQLVNDLTTAADSLNLNSAIRRESTKYDLIDIFYVHTTIILIYLSLSTVSMHILPTTVMFKSIKLICVIMHYTDEIKTQNVILLSPRIIFKHIML